MKNSMKKFSMKMRMFYFSLFSIILIIGLSFFIIKNPENIITTGLWAIVTLCGIATGGKVTDDWQRGLNFKSELYKTEGKIE
jgi:hypothetical protein